jgi:chromosome segregation ATPase
MAVAFNPTYINTPCLSHSIEDERNEVTVMRQDMEALQAMVVAQTAQLTVTQAPSDEIGQLQAELQLLRKLLAEAEKRAQTASIEREKAHNELRQLQGTLSRERKQRDKLQNQVTQAVSRKSPSIVADPFTTLRAWR